MYCLKPAEPNVELLTLTRFGQVLIMIQGGSPLDLGTERVVSSWTETFSVAPSFLILDSDAAAVSESKQCRKINKCRISTSE